MTNKNGRIPCEKPAKRNFITLSEALEVGRVTITLGLAVTAVFVIIKVFI